LLPKEECFFMDMKTDALVNGQWVAGSGSLPI
jgi:hypothetical protein